MTAKKKHPGGRPTKYKTEYCKTAVDLMADGASKMEVCGTIGICYDTFLDWQKIHKEFSESIKTGNMLSQAWWEREGRTSLRDNDFSYTGWYMNMKNRFKWADKLEHAGKDGGQLTINISSSDAEVL